MRRCLPCSEGRQRPQTVRVGPDRFAPPPRNSRRPNGTQREFVAELERDPAEMKSCDREGYRGARARPTAIVAGCFGSWPGDQEIAENQRVHLRALETIESFFRAAYDGLIVVEGSVEHDRHSGLSFKFADERVVTRIRLAGDGLQAAGAVDVRWRGNFVALLGFHGVREGHKRRWIRFLKPLASFFGEDRRCERPENFAMLDAAIESVFHLGAARIGYDAAIAERAGSPFSAALEPAEN